MSSLFFISSNKLLFFAPRRGCEGRHGSMLAQEVRAFFEVALPRPPPAARPPRPSPARSCRCRRCVAVAERIPIPGFKEFGVGDHESHPTPEMLKELGFKHGVVTTGSSFDHTEMDDKMMEENGETLLIGIYQQQTPGCSIVSR